MFFKFKCEKLRFDKLKQNRLKKHLFLKQKGKCPFCLKFMDYDLQDLAIHDIFSIKKVVTQHQKKNTNKIDNLVLFHNWCYFFLYLNKCNFA